MTAKAPASRPASAGFTLVEVLMAMIIMCVGLLGLLQSVNIAYDHRLRSRLREEALVVAEERMNELRVLPFDRVRLKGGEESRVERDVGGVDTSFTVSTTIDEFASGPLRLRVAVRWQYRDQGCEHEIFSVRSR